MTTSPSIDNYYVGKGVVTFAGNQLGNCPLFTFTPKITKLDHFSSMHGTKIKDKSIVLSKEGTLAITLEEWTEDNLAIALLAGSGGTGIYSSSEVQGEVIFTGANDVGPKLTTTFPTVNFIPSKALSLISDTWGAIELEGDVLADEHGSFGSFSVT